MSRAAQEIKNIPNDQYSCTQCDLVPEIIDIDYESGEIALKCPEHGEKAINVLNYFNEELPFLYYSTKCDFSKVEQRKYLDKNEYFINCINCNTICCPKCSNNHKGHKNKCIKVNEKNNVCEKHFKTFVNFCTQCKKNFCSHEKCKCNHELKYQIKIQSPNEKDLKEIKDKRVLLIKKKELQELLIKLLDTLIETCEKHPFNYYNNFNISNISKRIRETDNNKSNRIDKKIVIEKINNLEAKIIEFFNLNLKDKNIGNEEFELLSHVEFQNLKELDLGNNKISNIEPLKNINSKKLIKIVLSDN